MDNLAAAGFGPFKISVVVTRHNVDQLDGFKALADSYGAQLRVTRLRPSGRGVDAWPELHPTAEQQVQVYRWLLDHGDTVLTGDSFFHLNALGEPLPGLNLCGAGRIVCLIDPIGDVYACPFVIHDEFRAGNVRDAGGFARIWRESARFRSLREPQSAGACATCGSYDACQGGCMAAKFFTGLPLAGPDPECINGHGAAALAGVARNRIPVPAVDHSSPVAFSRRRVGDRALPRVDPPVGLEEEVRVRAAGRGRLDRGVDAAHDAPDPPRARLSPHRVGQGLDWSGGFDLVPVEVEQRVQLDE
jgi:radical SAM protein with 4Fe4S-binding SPASM domain